MDKKLLLKTFNNHFIELIDDIILIFPEDKEISTFSIALNSINRMNPKLSMKIFYEHIIKGYFKEIDDGDINFFINKDYNKDLHGISNSDIILKKIEYLREPVKRMSKSNQENFMKYIQNLKKLCLLYETC